MHFAQDCHPLAGAERKLRRGNEETQMFAQVAQGKSNPGDAVRDFTREAQVIYRKWQGQGLV